MDLGYAYGVDSPLTNTDPTGLCPNPSGAWGRARAHRARSRLCSRRRMTPVSREPSIPLTSWAKLLMLVESLSITPLVMVAGRAVNILK